MHFSGWIDVIIAYTAVVLIARFSSNSASQSHSGPYFVRPDHRDLILPCPIDPQFVQSANYNFYWFRTVKNKPRLIADGHQIKKPGYELITGSDCFVTPPDSVPMDLRRVRRRSFVLSNSVLEIQNSNHTLRSQRSPDAHSQNLELGSGGCYNLRIKQVNYERDNGRFECQIEEPDGVLVKSTVSQVVVLIPAQIDGSLPISNDTKNEREKSYELACPAIGQPAPNITWSKDGEPINESGSSNSDEGHWSISQTVDSSNCENNETCMFKVVGVLQWQTAIRLVDKGTYTCWAFNGVGQAVSANATLFVLHKPVIVNDPSRPYVAVDLSRAGSLTCRVNAKPDPRVTWFRDGQDLSSVINSSNSEYTIEQKRSNSLEDVHESTLTIGIVKEENMGEYVCKAENSLGQATFQFNLQTKTKPTMPSQLQSVERTHLSTVLTWRPGFNGGEPQTFAVESIHVISGQMRMEKVSESQLLFHRNYQREKFGIDRPVETLYNVTDLLPASDYRFRIKSINRLGETDWTPFVVASTIDVSSDPEIIKATKGVYNGDYMVLTFKTTTLDSSLYCILVYRQLNTGNFSAQNCYGTNTGRVEHLKPSNNFMIRFCRRQNFSCGPEFDVFTGGDGALTWQLLVAIGASILLLLGAVVALGAYCYYSRRTAHNIGNKKTTNSPSPVSATSSIVGATVNKIERGAIHTHDSSAVGGRRVHRADRDTSGTIVNPASRDGLYSGDDGSSAASSRQKQRPPSSEDSDSLMTVPVADVASILPLNVRRHFSSGVLEPSGSNNSEILTVIPTTINSTGNCDAGEHWGMTDGYGLSSMTDSDSRGLVQNGSSYNNPQFHSAQNETSFQHHYPDSNFLPSKSLPSSNPSAGGRPDSSGNQSNLSSMNEGKRVLSEIMV